MFKLFFCVLCILSNPLFAQEEFSVSFEIENAQEQDLKLLNIIQDHGVFQKIQNFIQKNLKLEAEVKYILHQGGEPFFGPSQNYIYIPYSFLHKVNENLQFKYPQQEDLRAALFSFTIEKLIWFELGRVLIDQYALAISGREEFALDTFSTLMLLNLSDSDSEYLLDATEEFLLIDDASSLLSRISFQSEADLDEQRYRMVVCIVLGKDNVNFIKLLDELVWDQKRLQHCHEHYQEKMIAWYEALKPFLKTENKLKQWLEVFPVENLLSQGEVKAEKVLIPALSQ